MSVMWKFAIYATIFYIIMRILSKISDRRKVKKYGRDIIIDRNNNRDNSSGNDDNGDDDVNGNADAGTDKQ